MAFTFKNGFNQVTLNESNFIPIKSQIHGVDLTKKAIAYDFDPLTENYRSITFDDEAVIGSSKGSSTLTELASTILSSDRRSEEVAVELALTNANQAFDAKFQKEKEALEDDIERATAKGEAYADQIKTSIDKQLAETNRLMAQHQSEMSKQTQDILKKVGANTSLATEGKTKAEQAQARANEAYRKAETSLSEAQASIRTVTSNLSSTRAELNQVKADLTSQKTKQSGIETKVTKLETESGQTKTQITQLATTSTNLGKQVSTLETDVTGVRKSLSSIWVGEQNLLPDTEKLSDQKPETGVLWLGRAVKKITRPANSTSWVEGYKKEISQTLANPKEMILSFNARANQSGVKMLCFLYNPNATKKAVSSENTSSQTTDGRIEIPLTSSWKRYWVRYTFEGNMTGKQTVIIGRLNEQKATEQWVQVNSPALYHGHYTKEWSPSDSDVRQDLATYKQTVTENLAELKSSTQTLGGNLTSLTTRLNQTVNGLSSLASKEELNQSKQTISQLQTQLTQQANQIKLKANQTGLDDLKKQLTSTQSELTVAKNAITQKVAQTDFNKATGRLSQAETTIQSLSNQIKTKLSQTEVNQLITSKGYVTSTTMTNSITQSVNGMTSKISQVEAKIPKEGTGNLLKDSKKDWRNTNRVTFVLTEGLLANRDYTLTSHFWRGTNSTGHTASFGDKAPYYTLTYDSMVDSWVVTFRPIQAIPAGTLLYLYSHPSGSLGNGSWVTLTKGTVPLSVWEPSYRELVTETKFHEVKDTVDGHTRTIGEHTKSISQVIQTADGLVSRVGTVNNLALSASQKVTATETRVQQHANSYAIKTLTGSGSILSQLNLNKDGTVRIDGKLVQITGTTLIQDGVITNAKIANLDAGKLTTGVLNAARIGAEAITASKLKVDQAFFNKLMANEAYLKQLFAKSAFINQVQAVTLSANKISGGILSAINGAMSINLNQGNIKFFSNSPSISREISGYPHQWVAFETGTYEKKPCGVTVIGSNRNKNWNANDGGFVGIRAWNGTGADQIDVVGDTVRLASSPFTNPDGWTISTLPKKLSIDAYQASDRPSSVLSIGDIRIYRNATSYVSLKDVLQQFNQNFKHLVNITGRGDVLLTWSTIK